MIISYKKITKLFSQKLLTNGEKFSIIYGYIGV